ncbi:hypothetical protein [Lacrimispora indolis]|uniref:hypothetical protein n=1 Tax=Lacrimispora indolis TaxID=69825 RepID=UPI0003F5F344|nr:hypothetical protein [[Clostridium] methoxybenzovorans]
MFFKYQMAGNRNECSFLRCPLSAGTGVIIDWCINDYSCDLMKQAEKDLLFVPDKLIAPLSV